MSDNKVREFLEINANLGGRTIDEVGDSDSLSDIGIMDSLVTIKLALFIEETFGFNVTPADFLEQNFDTIAGINDFISNRKS